MSFKKVVIELRDAPDTRLSGAPGHRLEIDARVLCCLIGFLLYFIAQAAVDLGHGLDLYFPDDADVDFQRCSRRHMAQHGSEGLVSMPFSRAW